MSPEYVASSRDQAADKTLEIGAGKFIFHEGDLGTEMFIIQAGQVEIVKRHKDEERQLAILG